MATMLITMFVTALLAAKPQPEPPQPPADPSSAHFLAGTPEKSPFERLFAPIATPSLPAPPVQQRAHGNCGMPVIEKNAAADPTFVRKTEKAGHIRTMPPPACGK